MASPYIGQPVYLTRKCGASSPAVTGILSGRRSLIGAVARRFVAARVASEDTSATGSGSSYLDMWKRVKEREKDSVREEEAARRAREDQERDAASQQARIKQQEMQFQQILQVR